MKPIIKYCLLLAITAAISANTLKAAETPASATGLFDDIVVIVDSETPQEAAGNATEAIGSNDNSRFTEIERRLSRLEVKAISAEEAEEIAERVVQKHITALRLAINTSSGGQRVKTVEFRSASDVQGIVLNPGETLSSYTDMRTGEVVKISKPTSYQSVSSYGSQVPVWKTAAVEVRSQPLPVAQSRRIAMRPVVATGPAVTVQPAVQYSRGLLGQTRARTCQIINGQQVCN